MQTFVICLVIVGAVAGGGCASELVTDETSSSASADSGFPCDVRAVMQTHCAACHTGHTYAPVLASREAFLVPATDGLTVGQIAARWVEEGKMPPAGTAYLPTDAERAVLIDWVTAGMPAGPCATLASTPAP